MSWRLTSDPGDDVEVVDCAAAGPHCGVCRHVLFGNDWDRPPHCSRWGEPTELSVGEVCSAFTPTMTAAVESG